MLIAAIALLHSALSSLTICSKQKNVRRAGLIPIGASSCLFNLRLCCSDGIGMTSYVALVLYAYFEVITCMIIAMMSTLQLFVGS